MTNKTAEYKGWTNYETWNVSLWIDNDPGLHEMINEEAKRILEDLQGEIENRYGEYAVGKDDKNLATGVLGDFIQNFVEENNPLAEQNGFYTDILTMSLQEVNYREIAGYYFEEMD